MCYCMCVCMCCCNSCCNTCMCKTKSPAACAACAACACWKDCTRGNHIHNNAYARTRHLYAHAHTLPHTKYTQNTHNTHIHDTNNTNNTHIYTTLHTPPYTNELTPQNPQRHPPVRSQAKPVLQPVRARVQPPQGPGEPRAEVQGERALQQCSPPRSCSNARSRATSRLTSLFVPLSFVQVDQWLDFCRAELDVPLSALASAANPSGSLASAVRADVDAALKTVDSHLTKCTYLACNHVTVADISLGERGQTTRQA